LNTLTLIEQIAERETAMTVPQLAKILSISSRSIYEHVAEGRLACIRIGSTIRLDPSQTAQWLQRRAA
jgi:excisionase family DNA binding protein